jgi:hypothetical protein
VSITPLAVRELDLGTFASGTTALHQVLSGERLLWHLPGFLDRSYCDDVIGALQGVEFDPYAATVGVEGAAPVLKVGPTVFDYFDGDFESYFDEAESCSSQLRQRFVAGGVVDPLDLLLDVLAGLWPGEVVVASEAGRRYFAGVLRSIAGGTLPHIDNASIETPDLSIGSTTCQGSILFYLRMPTAGGATKVYAKRPTPADPTYAWGYAQEALTGVAFAGVTPTAGDAVLFPTRFIHQVEPVTGVGERITFSAFYGADDDGRLVVWS